MKSTLALLAIAAAAAMASSAHAVSLSCATDKATYSVGENITLAIYGDTTGAGPAQTAFVDVVYDHPGLVDGVSAIVTQSAAITTQGSPWAVSYPPCSATGCAVIDQAFGAALPPDPANIIGQLELPVVAPGVLRISLNTVDWFGVSLAAVHVVTIIPEPATAGLLAAGLLGLAVSARSSKGVDAARDT
jgi:hypothetical protein